MPSDLDPRNGHFVPRVRGLLGALGAHEGTCTRGGREKLRIRIGPVSAGDHLKQNDRRASYSHDRTTFSAAIARAQLVDACLSRSYHSVTRFVRRAFLLGRGDHNRNEWLAIRLEELSKIFAVAVGGFSVMDNHLHAVRAARSVDAAWAKLKRRA
jgi:hypothetical protein